MSRFASEDIKIMQKRVFGRRFQNASLSASTAPQKESEAIIKWIKNLSGFLVIHGPSGTGKTHLLSSIYDAIVNDADSIRVLTDRDLFRKLRSDMAKEGDYLDGLEMLMDSHVVMIDDVGSSGHTEWREEILTEALDIRYRSNRPTILTSNLSKKEVEGTYGERIASRIFSRDSVVINTNSWEIKR